MTSHLSVQPRETIGPERWDDFVERSPEAWLWHTWDLQEALRTWPGSVDRGFGLLDDAGELACVVPLRSTPLTVARAVRSHELDSLGGPAFAADSGRRARVAAGRAAFDALVDLAGEISAAEVRMTATATAPAYRPPAAPMINPLLEFGGSGVLAQTWMLELDATEAAAWEAMEGRARTAVRKAEKAGAVVREAGPADLDAYFELHCSTYERSSQSPHPREYFEAIWSRFVATGRALVLMAEIEGRPVAAQSFAIYKGAAAYWTGASNELGLREGANNLLQWEALKRFLGRGLSVYEAGEAFPATADAKLRGLSDFKRSTGAALQPLHRVRLDTATGRLDVALRARDLLRSLRRAAAGGRGRPPSR